MSTTKETSQVKTKNTIIWILTIFFSEFATNEEAEIYCRGFVSKKLAQGAMRREARRLYKKSKNIQDAEDKYFEEYPMEIHFGERPEESPYYKEFGYCKVEPIKLEDKESGDDVPSDTDDESEDYESEDD